MSLLTPGPSAVIHQSAPGETGRNGYFPGLAQLPDGTLLCGFAMAEAMESADMNTRLAESRDGGVTWTLRTPIYHKASHPFDADVMKPTVLCDGRVLMLGYQCYRDNMESPLANPATGGLVEDDIILMESADGGHTFAEPRLIPCAWGRHVEASAPLYELADGSLATPITGFADWEGKHTARNCGRLLRSDDGGRTFSDDTICMAFSGDALTCFEQRMAQTASGSLVVIGWNEDTAIGKLYPNHYTYSADQGHSFSEPRSTGVMGQASSVCALGGEYLLAIHAVRRDTDRPGIYGYVVDVAGGGWRPESEPMLLWEPLTPVVRDTNAAEVFAYLKFGQPSALVLADKRVMMVHWATEGGLSRIILTPLGQI